MLLGSLARIYSVASKLTTATEARALLDAAIDGDRSFFSCLREFAALRPDSVPAGAGYAEIRRSTLRYMAYGWLHGWAACSIITHKTRDDGDDRFRARLLGVDEDGCLGALVRIYTTLREAGVTDEPLFEWGGDGVHLFVLGSYRHGWLQNERPSGVTSSIYLPAAGRIVGTPADAPTLDRDLLSIWGIINLELDTWRSHIKDGGGALAAVSTDRGPLASWLEALSSFEPLRRSFDLVTRSPAAELQKRAHKIARYLRARHDFADSAKRENMLRDVTNARRAGSPPPEALEPLVNAATPIGDERLHEASIWLAWVLLLSYRDEPTVASSRTDAGAHPDSLLGVWSRWGFPGSPGLPPNAPALSAGAELRWNQAPPNGHPNRLRADVVRAFLSTLEIDVDIAQEERARRAQIEAGLPNPGLYDRRLRRCERARAVIAPYAAGTHRASPLLEGEIRTAFRASASREEQHELVACVAAIEARLSEREATAALLKRADSSEWSGGHGGGSAWGVALSNATPGLAALDAHLQLVPTRSLKALADELANAIKDMSQSAHAEDETGQLRRQFEDARAIYRARLKRVLAARVGNRVASIAVRVAQHRHRVADLDLQLGEIHAEVARLVEAGAAATEQAKAARLALMTRYASLAVARVEAVRSLGPHLRATIDAARQQLNDLAKQARSMAKQIRDERERSFIIGIVKAVVSVVGAVLAPFTGGASSVVANLVNEGIEFAATVSKIDWDNLGVALGQLANASDSLLGAVDLGLSQLDVKPPEALGTIRGFLSDPSSIAEHVGAKNLVLSLRALRRSELTRLASAVASGFPVSVDTSSRVRLSGLSEVVNVSAFSEEISRSVAALMRAGAYVRANVERLGATLAPELESGTGLRAVLSAEMPAMFQQFDVETLAAAFPGESVDALRERFEAARERLAAAVRQTDQLSDEAARSLASLLARGALFVEEAHGRVVLWPREAAEEAQREAERLKREFENEVHSRWQQLSEPIERTVSELTDKMQRILDSADEDTKDRRLEELARNDVPRARQELDAQMERLDNAIGRAVDAASDQAEKRRISSFDYEAALSALAAARKSSSAAEIARMRAKLGLTIEELVGEGAALGADEAAYELEAEEITLSLEAERMNRAYLACVARGLNPTDADESSAPRDATALLSCPRGAAAPERVAIARRAAAAAAGMLGWLYFLDLPRQQGAQKRSALFSDLLTLALDASSEAGRWEALEETLHQSKAELDASRLRGHLFEGGLHRLSDERRFHWWEDLDGAQQEVWRARVSHFDLRVVGQGRVLCTFRAAIYAEAASGRPPLAYTIQLADWTSYQLARAYVHTPRIILEYRADEEAAALAQQLWFLIAAPPNARASERIPAVAPPSGRALSSPPIGGLKDAVPSLDQELSDDHIVAAVLGEVPTQPALVGAYGEWAGVIVSNDALSESERRLIRDHVSVRFHFAIVAAGDAAQ